MNEPYRGLQRKLVIAFDIGTTFSGISYAVLDPGEIPKISAVTRYPAQEHAGGDSKIPSIVYYDKNGAVRAAGAEARKESIIEQAEDEGWEKAEWFKLHLRPKSLNAEHIHDDDVPRLPSRKTVVDIFADFFKYLFGCARDFIQQSHGNGISIWNSLEKQIEFVLSHPNGWEGQQQSQMRRAAVQAGLVAEGQESHTRLQFVTEGEASLHFCVRNNPSGNTIKVSQGVIVVDAGGGTIDLSAYQMKALNSFVEVAPTECRLQGSIFVSRRARKFLEGHLRGSRYGTSEDIESMTEIFDKTTKTKFYDQEESSYIKFGSARDTDPRLNIRSGQLKLLGSDVAKFFEPSITATVNAIKQQRRAALHPISAVFLVGGFAASDWLFSRLQASLSPLGLTLSRPDHHVNKAVSDGAVSFFLGSLVTSRVAKWTYGLEVLVNYREWLPEHHRRRHSLITLDSGTVCIEGAWDSILKKVSEEQEFERHYVSESKSKLLLWSKKVEIKCYRGSEQPCPEWVDVEPHNFPTLCEVVADTSVMAKGLGPKFGDNGIYYEQEYDVVLLFGLTELKAQIKWMENGIEKRGPAAIVYEVDDPKPVNGLADRIDDLSPGCSDEPAPATDGWDAPSPASTGWNVPGPSRFGWNAPALDSCRWDDIASAIDGWRASASTGTGRRDGPSVTDAWGAPSPSAAENLQPAQGPSLSSLSAVNNRQPNNRGRGSKRAKQTAKRGGGPQGSGRRGARS